MRRHILIAMLLAMTPLPVCALPWTIDYPESSLTFTAMQSKQKVEGGFTHFTVDVELDPAAPEKGHIKAVVEMKSVTANTRERRQALPQREWFDVAKFPQATFESTSITKTADDRFEARGQLSIKGVVQEVVLPFTLRPEGEKTRAEGHFIVQRDYFHVGIGEWESEQWVAFPVTVAFSLLATPAL